MKLPGVPYRPRYTADEIVLGVVAGAAAYVATAVAIHAFPLGMGMVFVVGICGGFGAIVAIDDRL